MFPIAHIFWVAHALKLPRTSLFHGNPTDLRKMPNYMLQACICHYVSIDTDDIKLLTKNYNEVCCCTHSCCLAAGDKGYGISVDTNGDHICKINFIFCNLGFKKPTNLCRSASHTLCIKSGHSSPLDKETVTQPVCAIMCCQLAPQVEFAAKAPSLPSMVR